MVAGLTRLGVDLNWADDQYWVTLFKLIGVFEKSSPNSKKSKPQNKTKIYAKDIMKFVKQ